MEGVVQTFEKETYELIKVKVDGETITTTPTHPFYVPQKGWTEAIQLCAGDILVTCNGEYVVVELVQHELLETPITVYNFEVEDFHTYYVAADADAEFVLVHNKCRGNAVKKAWQNEYNNVKNGGNGISRVWNSAEKAELLQKGKVFGYVGHHMKSVKGYPQLAGSAENIQFLTRSEHLATHFGNWRNITRGRINNLNRGK